MRTSFSRVVRRFITTDVSNAHASTPTIPSTESLAGTVSLHRSYILLHSRDPPTAFPKVIDSPLYKALQLRVVRHAVLVNFAWREEVAQAWQGEKAYGATMFTAGRGRLDLPRVALDNLDAVEEAVRAHVQGEGVPSRTDSGDDEVHLYVCTHGARDCRCGETGGAVVSALRAELRERQSVASESSSYYSRVKIGEVGHVGGHKFAGNVLVFPHGDWLGYMKPEDAPALLNAIAARPYDPRSALHATPLLPMHWRGRMGLEKEMQIEMKARMN